jgi:hypothetical protein
LGAVGSAAWYSAIGDPHANSNNQLTLTDQNGRLQKQCGDRIYLVQNHNSKLRSDVAVKLYSSPQQVGLNSGCSLYATNHAAIYGLDPVNGGTGLSVGTLYTQYNVTEQDIRYGE